MKSCVLVTEEKLQVWSVSRAGVQWLTVAFVNVQGGCYSSNQ